MIRGGARAVHPRERGEHATSRTWPAGSSSRERGTPLFGDLHTGPGGFIPASAGTRIKRRYLRRSGCGPEALVHPRERGEQGAPPRIQHVDGLIPSSAGNTFEAVLAGAPGPDRFIPASAGNTRSTIFQIRAAASVHPPRAREHVAVLAKTGRTRGSSPRARGTPRAAFPPRAMAICLSPRKRGEHARGHGTGMPRFIPASGEHAIGSMRWVSALVHPPRARGTPLQHGAFAGRRFIPAGAGNTAGLPGKLRGGSSSRARGTKTCCFAATPDGSVHPRERGEQPRTRYPVSWCRKDSAPRERRFIPASAGNTGRLLNWSPVAAGSSPSRRNTSFRSRCSIRAGSSPRAREHLQVTGRTRNAVHPRERGEHPAGFWCGAPAPDRFILASASSTTCSVPYRSHPRERGNTFNTLILSENQHRSDPPDFSPHPTCQIVKDHPTSVWGGS